jgi:hypothetical protein
LASSTAQPESTLAEVLFAAVRIAIRQLLSTPMKDAEVAVALDVSNAPSLHSSKRWCDVAKQKPP